MHVRIFRPAKAATQSGRARRTVWRLEGQPETPRLPEPLMGWPSAGDTSPQVSLRFPSREDAVRFAEQQGWTYDLDAAPKERRVKPRSYVDRFRRREKPEAPAQHKET